jgi:hypothetical protein
VVHYRTPEGCRGEAVRLKAVVLFNRRLANSTKRGRASDKRGIYRVPACNRDRDRFSAKPATNSRKTLASSRGHWQGACTADGRGNRGVGTPSLKNAGRAIMAVVERRVSDRKP